MQDNQTKSGKADSSSIGFGDLTDISNFQTEAPMDETINILELVTLQGDIIEIEYSDSTRCWNCYACHAYCTLRTDEGEYR